MCIVLSPETSNARRVFSLNLALVAATRIALGTKKPVSIHTHDTTQDNLRLIMENHPISTVTQRCMEDFESTILSPRYADPILRIPLKNKREELKAWVEWLKADVPPSTFRADAPQGSNDVIQRMLLLLRRIARNLREPAEEPGEASTTSTHETRDGNPKGLRPDKEERSEVDNITGAGSTKKASNLSQVTLQAALLAESRASTNHHQDQLTGSRAS